MASDITLSSATRTNLLSLQRTTSLIGRTQERLSSGKKVNSALDDALSFFKARNLNDRASDLATVKDGIDEGINVIKAAVQGLESIESTLKQMKAIAASAKSAVSKEARNTLAKQYNELRDQVDALTADASYNGTSLIKEDADTLTVKFNEQTGDLTNELEITGKDSTVEALEVTEVTITPATTGSPPTPEKSAWSDGRKANTSASPPVTAATYSQAIDEDIELIDKALSTVRTTAQTFGTNSSMLSIRQDFTGQLINTLEGGAGDLVSADLNAESANMLSLQTRQSLGTISLNIAQQSEQAVLRLF